MRFNSYFIVQTFMVLSLIIYGTLNTSAQNKGAQVMLTVDVLPSETPVQDTLYMAATFNDWNPGDSRFAFQRHADGRHTIILPNALLPFEYKITRGSWETVEGDIQGKKIADRSLSANSSAEAYTIQVASWEDMAKQKGWNIIVNALPDNTPYRADIFVSGSFNNWKDHDSEYKLTPLSNGTYGIRLPKYEKDTILFKFHRGSWHSVECRANGRTQQNHIAIWKKGEVVVTHSYTIQAWEDLAGGTNAFFSFWLTCVMINSVVLALAVATTKASKRNESMLLALILIVTFVVLMGRLATYNRTVFDGLPHLLALADFSYFLLAPLYLLFLFRLTGLDFPFQKGLLFIPFLIQAGFYLPLLVTSSQQFTSQNVDKQYSDLFAVASVAGCAYTSALWIYGYYKLKQIIKLQRLSQQLQNYVVSLLIGTGSIAFVWLFSLVVWSIGQWWQVEVRLIHEYAVDSIWVLVATLTYVHTIQLIRFPFVLRSVPEMVILDDDKRTSPHAKEDLETLKEQLEQVMKKRKPYLNAGLGLQDLADAISVNMHTLSWVINEGYKKNFFDFVNEYRIEEFKRLVNHEQYKHYTFLALALEVGFSSKTTFNRAFKKFTGKTPREFFGSAQEAQLEGIG